VTAAIDRFWEKVDRSGDCWLWTGCRATTGYGRFNVDGRVQQAHRWLLESLRNEPIPRELDVDHLCRVRQCVNPEHLEVVTRAENMKRAPYMRQRSRAEMCRNGHDDWVPKMYNGTEYRMCRTCNNEGSRSRRRAA
jgi:hypothetical protein